MAYEEKDTNGVRRVKKTITIQRRPWAVYHAWRDIESFPVFMENLLSVERDGPRSHWVVKAPGGAVEWDAEVVTDIPGECLAWRSTGDTQVKNSGEVFFKPAKQGMATEMRVILTWEPPGGALGSAVAQLSGDHPKKQLDRDLMRFKQLMETGDIPTTSGQPDGRGGSRAEDDDVERESELERGDASLAWSDTRATEVQP
jgi:uncharacterized membrane protein